MKVSFYTLGCKVNQYEAQALSELFLEKGYEIVKPSEMADVYIITSCTVTSSGDNKSKKAVFPCTRPCKDRTDYGRGVI